MGKVFEATKYTYNNLNTVNQRYRHTYHAQTPVGWANDPNGFSYYNGKFAQFFNSNSENFLFNSNYLHYN